MDYSLFNISQNIQWNIYVQFGIDLNQKLLPGFMYNPQAFYMPEEVQDEITEWFVKNFKAFSKDHASIVTPEIFKKEIQWLILDFYPTSNEKLAKNAQQIVYKDWDL